MLRYLQLILIVFFFFTFIQYCFEPYPPITIREAIGKVKSYNITTEIPNFKKPSDESTPLLGFSVRVQNNSQHTLKGWDFGVAEVSEYNPGNNIKMNDVM